MKVSELPYKRVTIEEIKSVMDDVLARTRPRGLSQAPLRLQNRRISLLYALFDKYR